jgi:hypothetical protein
MKLHLYAKETTIINILELIMGKLTSTIKIVEKWTKLPLFFILIFFIMIASFNNCSTNHLEILFETENPRSSAPPAPPGAPEDTTYTEPFTINLTGGTEYDFKDFRYTLNGTPPKNCYEGTTAQTNTNIIISDNTKILKAIACNNSGNASQVTTRTYTYNNITPMLINANVVLSDKTETQLLLSFSEDINLTTSHALGNYAYDSKAYGVNINSANRQLDNSRILIQITPGIEPGAHELRVRKLKNLDGKSIIENGIDNTKPFFVSPPESLGDGPLFDDPFNDGTKSAMFVEYDKKIYLGTNHLSSKLFEMNYTMTAIQNIFLDADGTKGNSRENFFDYPSEFSGKYGCTESNPCDINVNGIDMMYASCIGDNTTPEMKGSECVIAGGSEKLFIGAFNTRGHYRSFWHTEDVSSATTTFTFTESSNPDTGGSAAYRSTIFIIFKDYLWNHYGAELGGGGRGGRICLNPAGCSDANSFLQGESINLFNLNRIGVNSGTTLRNGSYFNNNYGGQLAAKNYQVYNAINVMYEHDNDGSGSKESQLYVANGGFYSGPLGHPRVNSSDGGIMRTKEIYSTRGNLPDRCPNDSSGCLEYWEDVTPDNNLKWNSYMSIPLPENTAVTGESNCKSSDIEMDCTAPYNTFTPSLKAIPYMRTAPNGDLYMIRNACANNIVCLNGKDDCDFRSVKQTCQPGKEIPQIWMMPKNCGDSDSCRSAWKLVAEMDNTGKSNMSWDTETCGSAPNNKCDKNAQLTLLEFVGNYLYIGFDNPDYGANIWRTNMVSVPSGNLPAKSSFELVNTFGIDGTATNIKIFSHISYNDSEDNWLLISTGDGLTPIKLYRTNNNNE